MRTRKVTFLQCDNPLCDSEYEHSRDEPAPGYHFGKGVAVLGGGAPIVPFYACRKECVLNALAMALDY